MKKFLLLSILLFSFVNMFSQDLAEINAKAIKQGFCGVPFLSSILDSKMILDKNPNFTLYEKTETALSYNGDYDGNKTKGIGFLFYNNQFAEGMAILTYSPGDMFSLYKSIKQKYEQLYKTSGEETEYYNPGYSKEYAEEATLTKNAAIYTIYSIGSRVQVKVICAYGNIVILYAYLPLSTMID